MRKILLSVGNVILFTTPIATIVSCGSTSGYNDEDSKIQKLINSAEATQHLEILWQKKVLKQLYPTINFAQIEENQDVIKALKWFIESNVKDNPSYLFQLNGSIVAKIKDSEKNNITTKTQKWGFDKTYLITSWINEINKKMTSGENVNENILKPMAQMLIGDNIPDSTNFEYLGLKTKIFKTLIVQKYLEATKKEWLQVFKSENKNDDKEKSLTNVEKTLDPEKYWILSKKLINKHFGFYWEISLDATKSLDFVGKPSLTFNQANKQFQVSSSDPKNRVADKIKYSEQKTIVNKILTIGKLGFDQFVGFKGLKTVPSSTGKLDFSLSALKKITQFQTNDVVHWNGYMQKKELINEDIELIQENKDEVKLIKINVIMPIFKNQKLTFQFNLNNGYNSALLSFELLKKDSGIYNDAIKFFTTEIKAEDNTEARKAIILKIKNNYAKKTWKNKGLKFIE